MRRAFEVGGLVAAAVLIAFGVAAIVMGVQGSKTVNSSLKQEAIVVTPDMTRDAIAAEAKKAGLPSSIALPTANVAGKAITDGTLARDFAKYMRIHTLEATGGLTYAEMGRYLALATAPKRGAGGEGGRTAGADPATGGMRSSIGSKSSRSTTRGATSGSPRPR